MGVLENITFDMLLMSLATVLLVREGLILILPKRLAGPEGSFIKTGER